MGLDSNQRTLARAELQSAAINHSATHPRVRNADADKKEFGGSCQVCDDVFMAKPPKKNNSSPKKPGSGTAKGPGKSSRYIPAQDKNLKKAGKPGNKPARAAAPTSRDQTERRPARPSAFKEREPRDTRAPARPAHASPKAKTAITADLFGVHAVREAWTNPKRYVHALFITQNALKDFEAFLATDAKRPAPTIVEKEELDRAFPSGTVHQGIALSAQPLAELSVKDIIIKAQAKDDQKSVIVMLDQVTDPHNVGAILRSACAFGADGVVMQTRHTPEMGGILAKTACGAVDHIPVAYETNLSRALETLKEHHYTVIGMDEHAEKRFTDLPSYERAVIVLGAEGPGMRRLIRDHCDVLVTLPTKKPINSLNVSNAAAVALYALCKA